MSKYADRDAMSLAEELELMDARLVEVEQERDTLRAYGTCLPGCNWHERNDPQECDCGWYRLRATWDQETRKALEAE